ncbi:MAG: hypothetical protein FWD88_03165, partial [Treponema sp.]|nr:hypothetical protein [Treponema sp.]
AVHLAVTLSDITGSSRMVHQVLLWDNESFGFKISHNDLAETRRTGSLLFPFAKDGHEYEVHVAIFTDTGLNNSTSYAGRVIGTGGIYMTNSPQLHFTDDNRILALSKMPTFSEEVMFPQDGLFSYSVSVWLDEEDARSASRFSDGFAFPAHELLDGAQDYFGFAGYFSVIGQVEIRVFDGDMEWLVGIARTAEVMMRF